MLLGQSRHCRQPVCTGHTRAGAIIMVRSQTCHPFTARHATVCFCGKEELNLATQVQVSNKGSSARDSTGAPPESTQHKDASDSSDCEASDPGAADQHMTGQQDSMQEQEDGSDSGTEERMAYRQYAEIDLATGRVHDDLSRVYLGILQGILVPCSTLGSVLEAVWSAAVDRGFVLDMAASQDEVEPRQACYRIMMSPGRSHLMECLNQFMADTSNEHASEANNNESIEDAIKNLRLEDLLKEGLPEGRAPLFLNPLPADELLDAMPHLCIIYQIELSVFTKGQQQLEDLKAAALERGLHMECTSSGENSGIVSVIFTLTAKYAFPEGPAPPSPPSLPETAKPHGTLMPRLKPVAELSRKQESAIASYWREQAEHGFSIVLGPQATDAACGQGTYSNEALKAQLAALGVPSSGSSQPSHNATSQQQLNTGGSQQGIAASAISKLQTDSKGTAMSSQRAGGDNARPAMLSSATAAGAQEASQKTEADAEQALSVYWGKEGAVDSPLLVEETDDDEGAGFQTFLSELGGHKLSSDSEVSLEQQRLADMRARLADKRLSAAARARLGSLLKRQLHQNARKPEWRAMAKQRKALPVRAFKQQILEAIESNQVIIVSGETGSGKSTQVPQFLLEEAIRRGNGGDVSIVVTQPRRISALTLAKRVSAERCEKLGDVVGYKVRNESKVTHRTRLTFCTAGVLLRKLMVDPQLEDITHVFLDEVHERSTNTDFLLIALKQVLKRRPTLKVILMSATINADHFSEYFGGCPHGSIPGRAFPVQTLYLEDFLKASGYQVHNCSQYEAACQRLKEHQQLLVEAKQASAAQDNEEDCVERTSQQPSMAALPGIKKQPRVRSVEVQEETGPPRSRPWHKKYAFKQQDFSAYPSDVSTQVENWMRHKDGKVDVFLAAAAVRYIHATMPQDGSILVFLTGSNDIQEVHTLLTCGTDTFMQLHTPGKAGQSTRRKQRGGDTRTRSDQQDAASAQELGDGWFGEDSAQLPVRDEEDDVRDNEEQDGAIRTEAEVEVQPALQTSEAAEAGRQQQASPQRHARHHTTEGIDSLGADVGNVLHEMEEEMEEEQELVGTPDEVVNGMWVVMVHGKLPLIEQDKAFRKPPAGARKVVLATNVAETSITIPDVVYVLDCGRHKETGYDPASKLQMLSLSWTSQASAQQRAGRAGRVQAGVCYRLYPKPFHDRHMAAYETPELQRIPLEGLCLQVLLLGLGDPRVFLAQACDPPDANGVEVALQELQDLGAVQRQDNGTGTAPAAPPTHGKKGKKAAKAAKAAEVAKVAAAMEDAAAANTWELTPMGLCLAQLPLEPRLSKMLVVSVILGVLETGLTLAAGLSMRSPFISGHWTGAEALALQFKRQFAGQGGDECSDLLALEDAYAQYVRQIQEKGIKHADWWAYGMFVNGRDMRAMTKLRTQLVELLDDIGLLTAPDHVINSYVWERKLAAARKQVEERRRRDSFWNRGFVHQKAHWDTFKDAAAVNKDMRCSNEVEETAKQLEITSYRICRWRMQALVQYYSHHQDSVPLIKAMVAAGLYPQVAHIQLVDKERKQLRNVRQRVGTFGFDVSADNTLKRYGDHYYALQVATPSEGRANIQRDSVFKAAIAAANVPPQDANACWVQDRCLLYTSKVKTDYGVYLDNITPIHDVTLLMSAGEVAVVQPADGALHAVPDSSSVDDILMGLASFSDKHGMVAVALPAVDVCVRMPAAQAAALLHLRGLYNWLITFKLQEPDADIHLASQALCMRLDTVLGDGAQHAYYIEDVAPEPRSPPANAPEGGIGEPQPNTGSDWYVDNSALQGQGEGESDAAVTGPSESEEEKAEREWADRVLAMNQQHNALLKKHSTMLRLVGVSQARMFVVVNNDK